MPGDLSPSEFLNKMIRGDRPDPPPSVPAGRAHMNDAIRAAAGRNGEQPATGEEGEERPAPGSKPGRLRAGREQPSSDEEPAGMNFLLRDEATAVRRGWRFRD